MFNTKKFSAPLSPKVFDQFTTGQTKSQRIGSLVEYVDRQREVQKLLNAIERINPNAYAEFMSKQSEQDT